MKVNIEYIDSSGVSDKEIITQMKHIFGESAFISITPDNNLPKSCIKYAIQKLITDSQVVSFFDDPALVYSSKLSEIKKDVLSICEDILDSVIRENENKWT